MGPFSQPYGRDEPGLFHETVPGAAAMVEAVPLAMTFPVTFSKVALTEDAEAAGRGDHRPALMSSHLRLDGTGPQIRHPRRRCWLRAMFTRAVLPFITTWGSVRGGDFIS